MSSFAVVEDFDVLKQALSQLLLGFEAFPVDPVGFKALKKGLGDRVIIAVTRPAHALDHLVAIEFLSEILAGVLGASIRMKHDPWRWPTMQDSHLQSRNNRRIRREPTAERVSDDLTVEQFHDYGQVLPTALGS